MATLSKLSEYALVTVASLTVGLGIIAACVWLASISPWLLVGLFAGILLFGDW